MSDLIEGLRDALLSKDQATFERALCQFSSAEEAEKAALDLIPTLPDDIRRYWFEEPCDFPHDPASRAAEIERVAGYLLERRRRE